MKKTSHQKSRKNVVVMGGGTGTYTVLMGLKKYPVNLSAVVTMADDGGSTGVLRDELGVLPPGDARQCLVALSRSDLLMRELMNYRFAAGSLKGHSFGNILLSALEKVTGSFDEAVEKASDILRLGGKVLPATLDKVRLITQLQNGRTLIGESKLHGANLKKLKKLSLSPRARANPKALVAIARAHVVIIGPGDFYSSLVPILLVEDIRKAICKSRAKKIFVCNLMTKAGHTDEWRVKDFTEHMESYLGCSFDIVIYNNHRPPGNLLKRYARKGELPVEFGNLVSKKETKFPTIFRGGNLISKKFPKLQRQDAINRSLIRHNPDMLARIILDFLGAKK